MFKKLSCNITISLNYKDIYCFWTGSKVTSYILTFDKIKCSYRKFKKLDFDVTVIIAGLEER